VRKLVLDKKTGFMSTMPFEIYERTGLLFYSSDFTKHIAEGRTLRFNLPAGAYTYNGNLLKLDSPIAVQNIVLPAKERNIANPDKRYRIIWGDNPNKCTIYYKPGIILFDNSLKNVPLYIKYGIHFHEIGHHYYSTEAKADLYAAKKMLDFGFNPSQIGRVQLMALTNGNDSMERKIRIVQTLTKNLG
jgi:hypothetical protein